jgi:hypothetical protein
LESVLPVEAAIACALRRWLPHVTGWLVPKRVAAGALSIHRKPEDLYRLVSDFRAAPAPRPDVREVEAPERRKRGAVAEEIQSASPTVSGSPSVPDRCRLKGDRKKRDLPCGVPLRQGRYIACPI